jgi:hypothetical protein
MAHERDEQNPSGDEAWFLRRGGVVVTSASGAADPSPMIRANAYRRLAYGERLSRDEAAAVKAAKGHPLSVSGVVSGEVILGFLMTEAPALIRQVDALALKIGAKIPGLGELSAWQFLAEYSANALAAVRAEAFGSVAVQDFGSETESGHAEHVSAAESDDGPEGWSSVPPTNSLNPHHPDRHAETMARHHELVRADRIARGLDPERTI